MFISRSFRSLSKYSQKKDYYSILGVTKTASFEDIAKAYKLKAQKLYPDVSTLVKSNEQSAAQDFQDIAEAFAVLSNLQSRNTYDLLNKSSPNLIYGQERQKLEQEIQRNDDGTPKGAGDVASEYAKQKSEYLRKERAVFNVDEFGRYQGGLPQKNKGLNRGESLSHPSDYHRPLYHNMHQSPFEVEQEVTSESVEAYKNWSGEERLGKEWNYLYQVATVDYEYFKFHEYRLYWRWIRNFIIFALGLPYLLKTIVQTQNRYAIQEIQETLQDDLPILGKVINGRKVILGKTGTLRFEEGRSGNHH